MNQNIGVYITRCVLQFIYKHLTGQCLSGVEMAIISDIVIWKELSSCDEDFLNICASYDISNNKGFVYLENEENTINIATFQYTENEIHYYLFGNKHTLETVGRTL